MLLTRKPCHGLEVSGVKGYQHRRTRCHVQTCARGVALGNKQRPILGTVPCRNRKKAARRLATRQEQLAAVIGNELQGLRLTIFIQHRDNQPPVTRQPQAERRHFLPLQVGVFVRCGGTPRPYPFGCFGGPRLVFRPLFGGGFLGFGNTPFQDLLFGGGHGLVGLRAP